MGLSQVCHSQIYHEHVKGQRWCPYCLLYKYLYSHRPLSQMETRSPFCLIARKDTVAMDNIWYEEQRMGLRLLRGIVPKVAKKIKLEQCENFTFVSFTQVSRKLGSLNSYQ